MVVSSKSSSEKIICGLILILISQQGHNFHMCKIATWPEHYFSGKELEHTTSSL